MKSIQGCEGIVRFTPEEAAKIQLQGPEFRFPIELGKVFEYGNSIRSNYLNCENSVYHIPPFFLSIGGQFWGYTFENPRDTIFSHVDIDRSLLLLAGVEVVFFGEPPKVGDQLIARSKVVDSYVKRSSAGEKLMFIVISTDFEDESGHLVAVENSTLVKHGDHHD